MNFKISFAVTACNEHEELDKLLTFLSEHKRKQDEIVVQVDKENHTKKVTKVIEKFNLTKNEFNLNNDFASFKNNLKSLCGGDYIFQIDADELPSLHLVSILPELLTLNKGVDIILVPRINTVEGLTQEYIDKWKWKVDDKGWVNWPDYQWRIYKNSDDIKWINKVHEKLTGFKEYSTLPLVEEYALQHPKSIKKQKEQNNYYDTL